MGQDNAVLFFFVFLVERDNALLTQDNTKGFGQPNHLLPLEIFDTPSNRMIGVTVF